MERPKSFSLFLPFRFSNMFIICVSSVAHYTVGNSITDKKLVWGAAVVREPKMFLVLE